jgi:hypothetical protein
VSRVRKIKSNPLPNKNYFLIDACFFANKYIPINAAPEGRERDRIKFCREWWAEIENQLKRGVARVYIPDICIAETFKVLAKKYFQDKWISSPTELNNLRNKLRKDIILTAKNLRSSKRIVKFHDIPSSREIIISVDRFYELFLKNKKQVSLPDLILLATAKYLIDFYDIPAKYLHIITLDKEIWSGTKKIQELPNAYDPTNYRDKHSRIFK